MATTNPKHKFAVLFTGSTAAQYIADMQKVYDTLKDYYGYPQDNIKVFIGTHDTTWSVWTPPGYQVVTNIADFQHAYHSFVSRSTTEPDPEEQALDEDGNNDWNTMVFYITGKIDDTGVSPELIFREADPGNAADTDILLPMIVPIPPSTTLPMIINGLYNFPPQGGDPPVSGYLTKTSLHIVMQTDKAYSFRDSLYNNINSQCMSLTFATDSATVNAEVPAGSAFTGSWTDALKMVPSGGNYADEVNTGGGEPTDNLQISTRKACQFVHGTLTNFFAEKFAPGLPNPDDLNLGKPKVWIKDGDDRTPPEAWWESPDIWLTCPGYYPDDGTNDDNDYYVYDEDNTIHIRPNIIGSHPVRKVFIGAKVFKSGGGGAGEVHTGTFTPAGVLKPGEADDYTYIYHYVSGFTHRCIKARVAMSLINDTEVDDDTEWNPHTRAWEAQRNTDPSGLKSSSGGAGAGAGEGKADEADPQQDAEPDTDNPEKQTDTKTTKNLRSFKEHIYTIRNPFRRSMYFRYRIDLALLKRGKEFIAEWYAVDTEKGTHQEKLKIENDPYPHIAFLLKPGQEVNILNYIGLGKGVKIKEPLSFRFGIEAGVTPVRRFLFWRMDSPMRKKYRDFAGVTLKLTDGSFTLKGRVKFTEKELMKNAVVIAKTLNGRQSAAARVNEKGEFIFEEINPDIYVVYAVSGRVKSKPVTVHGQPVGKKVKLKPVVIEL